VALLRCLPAALALFFMVPAQAAIVTNRGPGNAKLTVIETNASRELLVSPSQSVTFCEKGCVVRLGSGTSVVLSGSETLAIEEGVIFLAAPGDRE
jgi:hypothetical protein